ncbi:MAG: hydrolase [Sphingomonas sp.]
MTEMTTTERDIIARVGDQPMLEQVRAWAAINSGTANIEGLVRTSSALSEAFGTLPGTLDLVAPDAAERVTPAGRVEPLDHGKHLHLTVRPDAPVQMLFTGHMDTVYPIDHPFQDQRWLDDNTLNGPGVADMKGGLAVMLAALKTLETGSKIDRLGYEIVINSDEETGSFSSAALLARAARGKVAALTYEPALPDGTLAGARGGTGNFSIVVTGKSAHAGRNPDDGRNAIVAASAIALRLMEAKSPTLSVNPARIDGGGPNNVVPDNAVLRVNFRPQSLEEIAKTQSHIELVCDSIATERDVKVAVHGGFTRPPKPIDPGAAALFDLVKRSGTDLGLDIAWRATGGVCDGNNIAAAGVPVVDTMGVRGGAIHSADEFLLVDSLAERAALSALTILRIAEKGHA